MAKQEIPKDLTGVIPFVIFGILMALVVFSIAKGTRKGKPTFDENGHYIETDK